MTVRGSPFTPKRLTWYDNDDCLVWKNFFNSEALQLKLNNTPPVVIYSKGQGYSDLVGLGSAMMQSPIKIST